MKNYTELRENEVKFCVEPLVVSYECTNFGSFVYFIFPGGTVTKNIDFHKIVSWNFDLFESTIPIKKTSKAVRFTLKTRVAWQPSLICLIFVLFFAWFIPVYSL